MDSGTRAIVLLFQLVLWSSLLQAVSCEAHGRDTDSKTNKQFFLVQVALWLSKVHHGLEGGRVSYGSAVVDTKGRRLTGLSHTSGRRSLQYCNVDTHVHTNRQIKTPTNTTTATHTHTSDNRKVQRPKSSQVNLKFKFKWQTVQRNRCIICIPFFVRVFAVTCDGVKYSKTFYVLASRRLGGPIVKRSVKAGRVGGY